MKIKVKDYIYTLKPINWIKGSFMVLGGILNTRFGIGVGRVNINIYFGLPTFFLITISGMLVVLTLRFADKKSITRKSNIRKIWISSAATFLAAFGLCIFQTVYYNLDILSVFLLAFIGILWFMSIYYGISWDKRYILRNIIINLSFSFGIIYGAALNSFFIPAYIFVFFLSAFFLQFSKDIINECKNIKKDEIEGLNSFPISLGLQNTHKITFIYDLLTILFLILPVLLNVFNLILYTIPMIISVIIVAFAALLNLLMDNEKTYYRIIKVLLRIGMFLVLTILILASF